MTEADPEQKNVRKTEATLRAVGQLTSHLTHTMVEALDASDGALDVIDVGFACGLAVQALLTIQLLRRDGIEGKDAPARAGQLEQMLATLTEAAHIEPQFVGVAEGDGHLGSVSAGMSGTRH